MVSSESCRLLSQGRTAWSARSLTLLDPTYAAKYLPIIASVSEHQPATWGSYVFDLHLTTLLAPLGLIVCLRKPTDGSLFAGIYGVLAAYFSGSAYAEFIVRMGMRFCHTRSKLI